jgi:hypothetical protein
MKIMKEEKPLSHLIFLFVILSVISFSCKSQVKDTTANNIYIEKIQQLFGSDVSIDGPLTIAEIESKNKVEIEKDGKKISLPFGYINDQWLEIKSKMKKGDRIFEFSTGPDSWANLAGRAGVIVLRKNKLIGTIITTMN